MNRDAVASLAMQRIFDEFMFTLNGGERSFVVDMLRHLQEEAVHTRAGALSVQSSRQLREYLQDEMSLSFLAAIASSYPLASGPDGRDRSQS